MTKNKIILLSSVVSMLYGFDVDAAFSRAAVRRAAQQAQQQMPVASVSAQNMTSPSTQNTQTQQSGIPSAPSQGTPTIASIYNTASDKDSYIEKGQAGFNDLEQTVKDQYVEKAAIDADYAVKTANIKVADLITAGASDAQDFVKKGEAAFDDLDAGNKLSVSLLKDLSLNKNEFFNELKNANHYKANGSTFAAFFSQMESNNADGNVTQNVIDIYNSNYTNFEYSGQVKKNIIIDSNFISSARIENILAALCERDDGKERDQLLALLVTNPGFISNLK